MIRSQVRLGASVFIGVVALTACAEDDASIAEPAPTPTASWTETSTSGPGFVEVDDRGGVLLLEGDRFRHLSKAGTETWSVGLDGVAVADVELEGDRASVVGAINPGATASIGGQVVDTGAANPNLPVAIAFEVSLAGAVGRVDVWQADEGIFFPSQITSLGGGRRAIAGTLSGSMTIGEVVSAQGPIVFITNPDGVPSVPVSFGEASNASFADLVADPTTDELFAIGTFQGVLDVGGLSLASGPNGSATFFGRLSSTGGVQWIEHHVGAGTYDARALPGGDTLVQGTIGESSFPLQLDGQTLVGPLAFRLGPAGDLVDAVALGREVRVTEDYSVEPGESYTMGSVAMTPSGAIVTVLIDRTLRETDGPWTYDDQMTVRHQGPGSGGETILFREAFPDNALLPFVPIRSGFDGSLALVISTLPTDPSPSNFSIQSSILHFAAP